MTDDDFLPPPSPPPFLGHDELLHLSQHGHLPIRLPAKLQDHVTEFFTAIDTFFKKPADAKASLYPGTPKNLEEGYHHVPDEKQFLSVRYASSTTGDPDLEQRLKELWYDISHLLFRILFDIGHFLDIDNRAWYPMLARALHVPPDKKSSSATLLRAFRYEPDKGISDAHTDVGLVTLCLGKGKGLELWNRPVKASAQPMPSSGTETMNGQQPDTEPAGPSATNEETNSSNWHDAPEVSILVGETLRILTTNRMPCGLHRVVANPQGRDSIVFALRPDLDTTLDLQMFGGWGEVPARALWEAIRKGKYNVNDTKEVREEVKAKKRLEKERMRIEMEKEVKQEVN